MSRHIYATDDGPVCEIRYRQGKATTSRWDGQAFKKRGAPAQSARVLYRLPEVIAAARIGETVWICQGEPTAEAVRAQGVTATTTLMGRGPWLPQYTASLQGAPVRVCIDATQAGAEYARLVRDGLHAAGITASIVTTPAEQGEIPNHLAAGARLTDLVDVPEEHLEHLLALAPDAPSAEDGVVLQHPTTSRLPDPRHRIPWSTGMWAYEPGGEGRRERGLYAVVQDAWTRLAPLPYVHARVVTRDAAGRISSVAYLISADADTPPVVIDDQALRTGTWTDRIAIVAPREDKTQRVLQTAILHLAAEAPERDHSPRVIHGAITVPCPETLPPGYLTTTSTDTQTGMAHLRSLIEVVAQAPKLALVLGASAVAPWFSAVGDQPHIVALYGDPGRGKTTALQCAAALWGDTDKHNGIVHTWNATSIGLQRFLGSLGVLPPFLDEVGQAAQVGPDRARMLYNLTNGARRIAADRQSGGVSIGAPWRGILFSSGNSRISADVESGPYAGLSRRVVDVPAPLTPTPEHAQQVSALLAGVSGHPGLQLLERHAGDAEAAVRPLVVQAAELVPVDDDAHSHIRELANLLRWHVAGAAMLDDLAGTGTLLRDAAAQYAREHVAEVAVPRHDADRLLEAVLDDVASQPGLWPTQEQYAAMHSGQKDPGRAIQGIRADDGSWVAVRGPRLQEHCRELVLDKAVALRELHARGVLHATANQRRHGEWLSVIRCGKAISRGYKLWMPRPEELEEDIVDDPEISADTPAPGATPTPEDAVTGDVTGFEGGCNGSVTGDVTGAKPALSRDVTGVTGLSGDISCTCARDTTLPPVESQRPTAHGAPCALCGDPADWLWDGHPLHYGECRRQWQEGRRSREDVDWLARLRQQCAVHGAARVDQDVTRPVPAAEDVPPHPDPDQAAPDVTPTQPMTVPPAATDTRPATAARRPRRRDRWAAPAAVLDAEAIHLPDQSMPWPEGLSHAGHLAQLAADLRLGHGGGEDRRYPSPGQIWLTDGALRRLGLPEELPGYGSDVALTRQERSERRREQAKELDMTAFVADARADGWEFPAAGLTSWSKVWHDELFRAGAHLVVLPWLESRGPALYKDAPQPRILAQRLAQYAATMGLSWRISSPATALDMIDLARPPRQDATDEIGQTRGRVAVVKGEWADLPPWLTPQAPLHIRSCEADIDWRRKWDNLLPSEREMRYVWAYDRNKSYLAPLQSLQLGVEGLQHATGTDASWDGTAQPGYYLCDPWEWPHSYLPDPGMSCNARIDGKVWVTSHTLRQLALGGIQPQIHEAYTWSRTARYLEGPARLWSEAVRRDDLDPAVSMAVKETYSRLAGKFKQDPVAGYEHLWRPDWAHHIIAASRTGIMTTLMGAQEATGALPLVVSRDLVAFATNEADPVQAWPGRPDKLSSNIGGWKPVGRALLSEWGPVALDRDHGYWRYQQHTQALDRGAAATS